MGAAPRRFELGEVDNPRDLIPGSPADLRAYAEDRADHSSTHDAIVTALRNLPGGWTGITGDRYADITALRVRRHEQAAEATRITALAVSDYADALAAAQRRASEAIDLYNGTTRPHGRDTDGRDTDGHDTGDRATSDSYTRHSSTVDPDDRRAEARELLEHARAQAAAGAEEAARRIRRAYDTLPSPNPLLAPDTDPAHTTPAAIATTADASGERTYTVHPGDTLSGIADRYLDDPTRWREIAGLNPSIDNPNLIFPGQRLLLPDTADDDRYDTDHRYDDNRDNDRDHKPEDDKREDDKRDDYDNDRDERDSRSHDQRDARPDDPPRDDPPRDRTDEPDDREPDNRKAPNAEDAPGKADTPPPLSPAPSPNPAPPPATPTPTPPLTPPPTSPPAPPAPVPPAPDSSTTTPDSSGPTPTPTPAPEPTVPKDPSPVPYGPPVPPPPFYPPPAQEPDIYSPWPAEPDRATPAPAPSPTPT